MKEESLEEYMERCLAKRWTELRLRSASGTACSNASTVCTSNGTAASVCLLNSSNQVSFNRRACKPKSSHKKNTTKKTIKAKTQKKKEQIYNKENGLSKLSIEIHSINKKLGLLNSKVAENELK